MPAGSHETRAIRLEASTFCQLACPLCPTPSGRIKAEIGSGFLRFDPFRRLVDDNPWLCEIELSNWGEIFLNPEIEPIIAYAYRRNVALSAWNGANLNHVKEPVLEALARYKFRVITCSIDGVTQESYAVYRRKGNLARVLDNVRKINAYKARWHSPYPKLRWQMIAFRHNAHEVAAARALAAELDMEFQLKANWDPHDPPAADAPPASPAAAPADAGPSAASEQGVDLSLDYCGQLWQQPQINFDGRLLGCCVNVWGSFGDNAFDVGLARALGSERLVYAKRMVQGTAPPRDDVPCTQCSIYTARAAAAEWVQVPPEPTGVGGWLRRRGRGRLVVWADNRFGRQLRPLTRAVGLTS